MHRLLPPNKGLQYKLRPWSHNLTLTCKSSYYDSCNFIARMLFREAYWRSCLCTYVLLLYFNLYTMFSALCRTCVCLNAVCHWFIKLLSDLIWSESPVQTVEHSNRNALLENPTLPYLTFLRGGCTRHTSAEASIWAQCATPTDLMVKKSPRGFCKPQENCPVDTVKSVQWKRVIIEDNRSSEQHYGTAQSNEMNWSFILAEGTYRFVSEPGLTWLKISNVIDVTRRILVDVCASSLNTFYPRDAMLARSLRQRRVRLSVHPSVRHTPVLCVAERKQDREMYTVC